MDPGRFVLSDTVWAKIEALLPGKKSDRGVTAKDNRLFLEAVLWRARAGLPWRDLPPEFGHWNSVFTRFRRWVRAMVFERIFKALSGEPVRGAKVWVDFAFIRNVPTSVFKKRRNSVSVVPVGGVCCTRLPTLLPLLREPVIGAKVRADFAPAHNVPQSDAQKWRNSVAVVPFATACCTCVPGLLPRLREP